MKRLKNFFKSALIGGLLVILPLGIMFAIVVWIFNQVHKAIGPLTRKIMEQSTMQAIVADILVIGLIITACFVVGVLVRTRLGKWIYLTLENSFLKKAPGYSLIKETVFQFLGNKQSPFSSVALVKIYGNDTLVSAFITDTHENGMSTVFVPTGPNPTSGNIFHLDSKYVFPVDIPVEDAMRSIISCGAGSSRMIGKMEKKTEG
ncbi:MAG: DUF502 domain-containing protein [Phycisphaeraceae bacterium]|nr:DUF502 domain-containing protein [Phycisphaeraceae bacterium]